MEGFLSFGVIVALAYVGPLLIFVSPILVAPGLRRQLMRWDFGLLVYPPVLWAVLMAACSRPKGMTNAYVELILLAVAVAIALFLRVTVPTIVKARGGGLLVPTVALLSVAALALGMPPFSHYDLVQAWWYVHRHPDLPARTRNAIMGGVVAEGMSPEQAGVAGGQYIWNTRDGELTVLRFNNLSQFGTDHPVGFNAHVTRGAVSEIERLRDLESCREYMRQPRPEAIEYPYAGFWKKDCEQSFGLRFERGGGGHYVVRFCGPGGCMEPGFISDCTPIPDERNYEVVDQDTVVVRRGDDVQSYKRCAP